MLELRLISRGVVFRRCRLGRVLAQDGVSTLRVLTVGLNPSLQEFPADRPFSRFPLDEGTAGRGRDHYLYALSSYFRTDPYRAWFRAFEPLLNGAGASYYEGFTSTALHTDICSPVATDPTWKFSHPGQEHELGGCFFLHSIDP